VAVAAGQVRVDAKASAEFAPQRLDLVSGHHVLGSATTADLAHSRPGPAELVVDVPGRTSESVVVVAQNYNAGWTATTASGETLAPIRVNGWQQGWVVPAGAATTLAASFAPDRAYQVALALGLLLLLVGIVLGLLPVPRGRSGAGRQVGPASGRVVGAASLGLVALAGGWPGLVAVVLVGLVLHGRRAGRHTKTGGPDRSDASTPDRRPRGILLVAAAAGPVVAAAIVAASPWPSGRLGVGGPLLQVLVWLAVAATCWTVLADERPALSVRARRMTGRSTST
jgi:arabinofuranan 3-O-arabinosyltransferase